MTTQMKRHMTPPYENTMQETTPDDNTKDNPDNNPELTFLQLNVQAPIAPNL
jgi:hypothetical protein